MNNLSNHNNMNDLSRYGQLSPIKDALLRLASLSGFEATINHSRKLYNFLKQFNDKNNMRLA